MKKGLDLQGGLEVVLKAQPPQGPQADAGRPDRSVSIMRNRVDKLGVASPEIRKQTPDEIVIQLAGVHNPQQAAAIIGKTAQLELYDLEPALVPPSVTRTGDPVAYPNLYQLLSRVQATAKIGHAERYVLFKPVKVHDDDRHRQEQEDDDDHGRWVRAAAAGRAAPSRPVDRQRRPARLARRQDAEGLQGAAGPAPDDGDHVHGLSAAVCPGDPIGVPPAGTTDYYLFKHGLYPIDRYGPYPEHDRQGAEALRHARRTSIRPRARRSC